LFLCKHLSKDELEFLKEKKFTTSYQSIIDPVISEIVKGSIWIYVRIKEVYQQSE